MRSYEEPKGMTGVKRIISNERKEKNREETRGVEMPHANNGV